MLMRALNAQASKNQLQLKNLLVKSYSSMFLDLLASLKLFRKALTYGSFSESKSSDLLDCAHIHHEEKMKLWFLSTALN